MHFRPAVFDERAFVIWEPLNSEEVSESSVRGLERQKEREERAKSD